MRTLVVEDEKHLNRMISEAILDEGYSVDSCFNALEALELCECAQYDVIVLDIMMPKMDGFEFVRRIRENGCKTPVVYLTSRDSVSDKVRGLESGGDYYMVKPFDFRELIAVIHVMARKSECVRACRPQGRYLRKAGHPRREAHRAHGKGILSARVHDP